MADTSKQTQSGEDLELVQDFLQESEEHLSNVEAALLSIEADPGDKEALHSAFRAFHTIKGISGFLGLTDIQALTHEAETLLDLARGGKLAIDSELVDLVLSAKDNLKALIQDVARSVAGDPPIFDATCLPPLLAALKAMASGESAPESPPAPTNENADAAPPPAKAAPARAEAKQQESSTFLKVDTAKLDALVELVGELVITQSQVAANKVIASDRDERLRKDLDQLEKILKDVQDLSLSLRMVPIKGLFQKMTRVVRDLARSLGKEVRMDLSGEETELDKTVIEQMHDPLVHMIRNSLDHGIESPQARQAAGKPTQGCIRLTASHRAGNIVIEIHDDGKGLDKDAIAAKARAQGLIGPDQQLSDSEIYQLVFRPGFSTAKEVTSVSGRGVGMDVVHRNIKALRGRVDVESTPGKGSLFTIRLPLTLAIIEGMVIRILDEQYIIPIAAVRESMMLAPEAVSTIEGRGEMVQIRGVFVPIVRLEEALGHTLERVRQDRFLMVVLEHEGRLVGLRVDDILGQQQVVIKSLGDMFANLPGIAGCAILGDGRVCMILDVAAVVTMAS